MGWMILCQGIAYLLLAFYGRVPLTTSYARQAEIMPLWMWGAMLLVMGAGFVATSGERQRRHWFGRLSAVVMLGLTTWFAITFLQASAWSAFGQYAPILMVIWGEITFVTNRAA